MPIWSIFRLQQRLLLDVGNPRLRNFLVVHNKVTIYHQSAVTVQNILPSWQPIIETQIQWFYYKTHRLVILYPWNHKILHAKHALDVLVHASIEDFYCMITSLLNFSCVLFVSQHEHAKPHLQQLPASQNCWTVLSAFCKTVSWRDGDCTTA